MRTAALAVYAVPTSGNCESSAGPEVRSREARHDHANDYKVEKATHREYRRQRNTSHADVRREHVSSTSKLSHEVKKPPAERAHAC